MRFPPKLIIPLSGVACFLWIIWTGSWLFHFQVDQIVGGAPPHWWYFALWFTVTIIVCICALIFGYMLETKLDK